MNSEWTESVDMTLKSSIAAREGAQGGREGFETKGGPEAASAHAASYSSYWYSHRTSSTTSMSHVASR